MARIPLNKAQLRHEKENLTAFRRYLPALDLKRQLLMAERQRARQRVKDLAEQRAALVVAAGADIPMLADARIKLEGLVTLGEVKVESENVAGARLPVVADVEIRRTDYGRMVRPHWVDAAVERLAEAVRLAVEARVAEERLALVEKAVAKITQRVNLFDKLLIPETEGNIAKINVYLGDAERAAVVRSKIAKRKHRTGAEA